MPGEAGFRSLTAVLLFAVIVQAPHVRAQIQTHDLGSKAPSFEVVSIRGYKSGYWPTSPSSLEPSFTADGFTWKNAQTQGLITYAYDLRDPKLQVGLIPGAPKWIRSEWFDIRARFSDSDIEKMSKMKSVEREAYRRRLIQSLLADRFKLQAHLVSKEGLAYELVVMKGGPKNMKIATPGGPEGINAVDSGDLQYYGTPLEALLMILPQMLQDSPVIDKTGLTGKYDFELKWARDAETWRPTGPGSAPEAPTDGSRPSIFKALEEELGLKLLPVKTERKGIAIDHIERPSPN
jgi:bla regulator protein BlaR1